MALTCCKLGIRCDKIAFQIIVSCHLLSVGHGCDENAYEKMTNVTHKLMIIGYNVAWAKKKYNVTHSL